MRSRREVTLAITSTLTLESIDTCYRLVDRACQAWPDHRDDQPPNEDWWVAAAGYLALAGDRHAYSVDGRPSPNPALVVTSLDQTELETALQEDKRTRRWGNGHGLGTPIEVAGASIQRVVHAVLRGLPDLLGHTHNSWRDTTARTGATP